MVLLGKISKSRGNKGEVICKISPEIDLSNIDFSGEFKLKSKKHIKTTKMESYSERGSSLIAKFDISNSINDALGLVGYDVYYGELRSDISSHSLEGYLVFDVNGLGWGKVCKVDLAGPNKMIETFDGAEYIIIPFDDSIILKINSSEKTILIDPPDGLKNLNK